MPDESGVNTQGRPLHLRGGGWAVPYDQMADGHSRFVVLDEGLESCEKRGEIWCPPSSLEPSSVQLPDGRIITYLRVCPSWNWDKAIHGKEIQGHIWKVTSDDELRTFCEPITTNLRNPSGGIDIALGHSGRLAITYNDSYTLRLPLWVRRSAHSRSF
jgi:hypothetical protein